MNLRVLFASALVCLTLIGFGQVTKVIVKPSDAVSVVCEEEPSLSKHYSITRDGYIVMQFVGAVAIAGLDERSAAAKIAATLIEQRILPRATITLKVLGAAKTGLISYTGAVGKAGEIYPRSGLKLSDVVAEAKPTAAADMHHVRIVAANGAETAVDFAGGQNPELRAGDRVIFELVAKSQDLSVTGMVKQPGVVPFKQGITLAQALELAGGLTADADPAGIKIDRKGAATPGDLKMALAPGDSIFVPQRAASGTVKVGGQVTNPIPVPFREGMTLSQAIEAAGGLKPGANPGNVKVSRDVDGKRTSKDVDYGAIKRGMSSDFPLKANDDIMVGAITSRRASFNMKHVAGVAILGLLLGLFHF